MGITGFINNRAVVSGEVTAGIGGTKDYNELENLPKINDIEVSGDNTGHYYNLANLSDIPTYNLIKTKLYDSGSIINGAPMNTNIPLSDNLSNYDLCILIWNTTEDRQNTDYQSSDFVFFLPNVVLTSGLENRLHFSGYGTRWGQVSFTDTTFNFFSRGGDLLPQIYSIWGIKLGAIV